MSIDDLLKQADVAYRAEMENRDVVEREEKERVTKLVKDALPEDVHDYLFLKERLTGGWRYLLLIPECYPVEVTFTRTVDGLQPCAAFVLDLEYRQVKQRTDFLSAIGRAHVDYVELKGDG